MEIGRRECEKRPITFEKESVSAARTIRREGSDFHGHCFGITGTLETKLPQHPDAAVGQFDFEPVESLRLRERTRKLSLGNRNAFHRLESRHVFQSSVFA
jgi:hypothetical protein